MSGRRGTRRGFLGALVGGVALLGAGRISGVRAEATKAPDLAPGQLKSDCDAHEGTTYVESKKDDVSACFWSDKSKTVCKFNGKDCYNYPPPKREETGGGPFVDSTGEIIEILPMEVAPTAEEPLIGGGLVVEDVQWRTGRGGRSVPHR